MLSMTNRVYEFDFFPIEFLKCTACGQKFRFPGAYGIAFLYTDISLSLKNEGKSTDQFWDAFDPNTSKLEFHRIPKRRIWCVDCNEATYAERIPHLHEIFQAAAIIRRGDQNYRSEFSDELLSYTLDDLQTLATQLKNRTAPAHCLMCGGINHIPIHLYEGHTVNGFYHEPCWNSPFRWSISVCSFNGPGHSNFHIFSYDGELLWKLKIGG